MYPAHLPPTAAYVLLTSMGLTPLTPLEMHRKRQIRALDFVIDFQDAETETLTRKIEAICCFCITKQAAFMAGFTVLSPEC